MSTSIYGIKSYGVFFLRSMFLDFAPFCSDLPPSRGHRAIDVL